MADAPIDVVGVGNAIVDVIAQSDENLSTLVFALETAGLVETFDQPVAHPSYTVFAPENAAFAALPDGVLDSLVADPAALGDVLGLHVVRGRLSSSDLRDGQVLHAAEVQAEQQEGEQGGNEGLGRNHGDLGTGVQVDPAGNRSA